MLIGVGITVHNRNEIAYKTIEQWKKYLPENAILVIVDDASDKPIKGASYRFEHNVGIAKAKNKCLELLEDCDYIFLSDDDCYPIRSDWYEPYINSGSNHLSFTFSNLKDGRPNGNNRLKVFDNGVTRYFKPCGCMLFLTKKCLETIGGFDEGFVRWGYEHVEYSNRAYNAKLIPFPFLDVSNSMNYFYSLDWEQSVETSSLDRAKYIDLNRKRMQQREKFSWRLPYKREIKTSSDNVVLCAFLTSYDDVQTRKSFIHNLDGLNKLIESVKSHGVKIVVFHDCFESVKDSELVQYIKVEKWKGYPAHVYRFLLYKKYLSENIHKKVWMVDSTDVEMLSNPFRSTKEGILYVGSEFNEKVNNLWMQRSQFQLLRQIPDFMDYMRKHANHELLNCGLIGGSYAIITRYLNHAVALHEAYTVNLSGPTDMGILNYVCFKFFEAKYEFGGKINTRFKKYEYDKTKFWKHK